MERCIRGRKTITKGGYNVEDRLSDRVLELSGKLSGLDKTDELYQEKSEQYRSAIYECRSEIAEIEADKEKREKERLRDIEKKYNELYKKTHGSLLDRIKGFFSSQD